jgi:outer membrane protein TolC
MNPPRLFSSLLVSSVWLFAVGLAAGLAAASHADEAADFNRAFAQLTAKSLQKSPDLQGADALLRQREGQVHSSWARWLPRANLKLSQQTSKDYSLLTGGALGEAFKGFTPSKATLDNWTFNVSMPLYNRATHLGVRQAHAEHSAAEHALAARRSELDWKLRQRLGGYLLALFREAASKTALETARRGEREAQLRLNLGQRTRVDLLKAQANVSTLEAQLIESEREIIEQRSALLTEYGLAESDLTESGLDAWKGSEARLADALTALYEDARPMLDRMRPYLDAPPAEREARVHAENLSWKSLIDETELAETRGASLLANEWPELALQANYGKSGAAWDDAFAKGQRSYSYGIALTVPFSLGGGLIGAYREAANAQEAARIKFARDGKSLVAEVESQRVQVLSLLKSFEAGKLRVSQNEEIQRLTQKSYELGKTGTLELLTAQNDLLTAKTDFASTKVKLAVLIRQLAWNLGVSNNE